MRNAIFSALLLSLTATACITDEEGDELAITCEGKCDGLSSVRALVADAKKLDLQDLINVGATYATDALRHAFDGGTSGVAFTSPVVSYLALGSLAVLGLALAARVARRPVGGLA